MKNVQKLTKAEEKHREKKLKGTGSMGVQQNFLYKIKETHGT